MTIRLLAHFLVKHPKMAVFLRKIKEDLWTKGPNPNQNLAPRLFNKQMPPILSSNNKEPIWKYCSQMLALGLWIKMLDLSDKLGKILIRLNNPMAKIDYLKVFPADYIIKECLKIRGYKTINTLAKTLSSTKTMPRQTRRLRIHTINLLVWCKCLQQPYLIIELRRILVSNLRQASEILYQQPSWRLDSTIFLQFRAQSRFSPPSSCIEVAKMCHSQVDPKKTIMEFHLRDRGQVRFSNFLDMYLKMETKVNFR